MIPLLLEVSRLKDFSVMNGNTDAKLIEPSILNAQELYLKVAIGKDLYSEICTQVTAGTVSVLNKTLLDDYIENFLINKTIELCLVDLNYKLTNKAIMETSAEFGAVVGVKQLSLVEQKYRNQADAYLKQLTEYLEDNSTDYPLYKCIKDFNKAGGLFFGRGRKEKYFIY